MNARVATVPTLTHDLLIGSEWGAAQIRELYHLAADIKARPERAGGALPCNDFRKAVAADARDIRSRHGEHGWRRGVSGPHAITPRRTGNCQRRCKKSRSLGARDCRARV